MISWKPFGAPLLLVFVAACTATPDLSGWAENSADLAGAINSENAIVIQRLDQNIAELEIGEGEGWQLAQHSSADWKQKRAAYVQGSADIAAVTETMVRYADALANLAAAGETGAEAATSIGESVGDILSEVGQSNPVSGAALAALQAFADAWTRAEAQDGLADAMIATDPEVQAMAELIAVTSETQKDIVEGVRGLERRLIRQAAGPNRMSWYARNQGYLEVERTFEGAGDGGSADLEHIATVTSLIQSLEPRFRERSERRVESTRWVKARREAQDAIAAAAADWRQSHLDAARLLARCGGLRSLRAACGTYTAASLRLAADRIRTIIPAS